MIRSFGSFRNSRISGVMVTSWLPRRKQPHVARAQQAEPGLELRLERMLAVGVGIVARAEQGEIVGGDPLQKLDRFGDLVGRQRRRIGAQFGGDFAGARQHRPPVLHADAHVGEHAFERADDLGALRRVLDAGDMDVDEAFALAVAFARALEVRRAVPSASRSTVKTGCDQQADVEPAFGRARRAPNRPGTACRR